MDYGQAFQKLLSALFDWASISGTYYAVKFATSYYRSDGSPKLANSWWGKPTAYLCCIGFILLFSHSVSRSLGTHVEDDDPLRGGGVVVGDYEVSEKERNQHFIDDVFLLLPVALFGVYKGYKLPLPIKPKENE